MIGAEVKHEDQKRRRLKTSAPLAAPLRGYPTDSSVWDIATARRLLVAGDCYDSSGELKFLLAFKLSPPSKKISEFSTKRSAIAVAIVVLNRMLPQSENGVFVVMMVDRLWLWRVEMTW